MDFTKLETPETFKTRVQEYLKNIDIVLTKEKDLTYLDLQTEQTKQEYILKVIDSGVEETQKDTTVIKVEKFLVDRSQAQTLTELFLHHEGRAKIKKAFLPLSLSSKEKASSQCNTHYLSSPSYSYRLREIQTEEWTSTTITSYLLLDNIINNTKEFVTILLPKILKDHANLFELSQALEGTFDYTGAILSAERKDKDIVIYLATSLYNFIYKATQEKE